MLSSTDKVLSLERSYDQKSRLGKHSQFYIKTVDLYDL